MFVAVVTKHQLPDDGGGVEVISTEQQHIQDGSL